MCLATVLVIVATFSAYKHSSGEAKDVYGYIPTVDGGGIPVPYAHPDQDAYLSENEAHFVAEAVAPVAAEVGSRAVVPEWDWVDVENQQPITQRFSNGTEQLAAGDTCGIETGGESARAELPRSQTERRELALG